MILFVRLLELSFTRRLDLKTAQVTAFVSLFKTCINILTIHIKMRFNHLSYYDNNVTVGFHPTATRKIWTKMSSFFGNIADT